LARCRWRTALADELLGSKATCPDTKINLPPGHDLGEQHGLPQLRGLILSTPTALRRARGAVSTPKLPLATPTILAGVRTAAVINGGTATLVGFIGAGGYCRPILRGIDKFDVPLMLEGAIPAALLALAIEALFGSIERAVPRRG
jgi:hypothetical protein